jgi:glutaredoxin 3
VAKVTIYTTMMCPYCARAKSLLDHKGVEYEEIDVTFSGKKRRQMTERAAGRYTVPQIFIGDRHVGGCDELYALEQQQRLDPLLRATSVHSDADKVL